MATRGNKSPYFEPALAPDGSVFHIGIACAQWNNDVTTRLLEGALNMLLECGVKEENIALKLCPGALELPLTSQWLMDKKVDGVIAIGSVIKGETPHFEYVCHGVTHGLMDVCLKFGKPLINCVLTDLNHVQAMDRSGGKHGNKGSDSALALLKMLELKNSGNKKPVRKKTGTKKRK